ncbi:galactosyltransferase-related protein [Microbacterium sp. CFBP 8794]|uniref:galactosyltransferase-related protein n=1 Tax=Microbacterium sp. CFBP 8794 TaxID=2775269 RepID=UPI001781B614|nr:glycosyltransferase family 2 protein [Microbacterium sp. CFBP 8794]
MRTALITVASAARREHLERQRRVIAELADDIVRVEAWLDETPPDGVAEAGTLTVLVPPGPQGLRVGVGRNRAADAAIAAGAELLVFLDVDCLPGPDLLPAYRAATRAHPDAVLCGAVTYLSSVQRPENLDDLPFLTRPHRARPALGPGETRRATDGEYDLFWSLSFAVTPATWDRIGAFHPGYEGYGAEDTDLAWSARAAGVEMQWVGGADAYHQWHPVSSPPWQHLDDILRNGGTFFERWGAWPMGGWLDAFATAGAIERRGDGWVRVR